MKPTYIRPIESIFEGPEILKVWPWELQLPGLRGLPLEPTQTTQRVKSFKIAFQLLHWRV